MRRELVGVTDMAGEYLQECRRWIPAGDRRRCALPVAVALTRSYGGKLLSDVAFVADRREYVSEEYEREEQPDLSLLDVGFDGGILTIASGGGALPYDVRVDVTDLAGRSYLGGILPAGQPSLSLSYSALPHGAYLVVLCGRESVRKGAVCMVALRAGAIAVRISGNNKKLFRKFPEEFFCYCCLAVEIRSRRLRLFRVLRDRRSEPVCRL